MAAVSQQAKRNQALRNQRYRHNNPKRAVLHQARCRAKKRGIKFELTVDDIPDMPTTCPVLGIPIVWEIRGKGGWYDDSPSLDRIKPALGYVPGNVRFISNRANRLKADATVEELRKVYEDARCLGY